MSDLPPAVQPFVLQKVLDASRSAIIITDCAGEDDPIVYANQTFYDLTGYGGDEVIGRNCRFLQGKDTDPKDIDALRMAVRSGRQLRVVIRNYKKDGTPFWNDLIVSPVLEEGAVTHYIGLQLDASDQVDYEEKRRETERQFADLFMQAPAIIGLQRGPEHRFELVNPLYQQLFPGRKLVGKTYQEAVPELKGQGFFELIGKVYQTGEPFRTNAAPAQLDRGTGRLEQGYFNFVYQPIRDSAGTVEGIMTHAVEVTDQVIATQKLEESEGRYRTLFESIDEGFCIVDMTFDKHDRPVDYLVLETNPAFIAQTGLKDPVGKYISTLVPKLEPAWMQTCGRVALTGESVRFTNHSSLLDRQFDVYIARIGGGESRKLAIVFHDITDRLRAESDLKELNANLEQRVAERTKALTAANKELARSNEELEDFAYVASHDLQEPLRKITAFSELLESDHAQALPQEALQYISGLQRSSARMRTLIDDLLTYSRVTTKALPFKEVSLQRVLDEVLEDLQPRIAETSAAIKAGTLGSLEADPLQLRLLLQNLLSNALKYKKPDTIPKITLAAKVAGEMCVITVKDNGIGFNEEYRDRIFTIFQRLHGRNAYEGTGIGLAICKKIADRHGGSISAQSREGIGSTFTVTLPRKQKR